VKQFALWSWKYIFFRATRCQFFKKNRLIYLFARGRERKHKAGGGAEGEGESDSSLGGSLVQARSQESGIMT